MAFRNICVAAKQFSLNKQLGLSVRHVVSALHIPGHVAQAAVSILTPSLDHVDRMISEEKEATRQNLVARKMVSFPLEAFIDDWQSMKKLRVQRETIEAKRNEVSHRMRQIVSENSKKGTADKKTKRSSRDQLEDVIVKQGLVDKATLEEIEALKEEGKTLRSQLKDLMPIWWDMEEKAVTRALSLPNILHPATPLVDDRLVRSFRSPPAPSSSSSFKEVHSRLQHVSPTAYYLEGDAALLELEWMRSFSQKWIEQGFHLISAPDFVKSLIVDGCALDFNDPDRVMCLAAVQDHGNLESGNGLHLVGGASLPAVVAFLTKNVIQGPYPLRLVSAGRSYQPVKIPEEESSSGLLNTTQASAIQVLTSLESDPQSLSEECSRMEEIMFDSLQQLVPHIVSHQHQKFFSLS